MLSSDPVRQVAQGPAGPTIGAFFDLDGTLVAGFTTTPASARPAASERRPEAVRSVCSSDTAPASSTSDENNLLTA